MARPYSAASSPSLTRRGASPECFRSGLHPRIPRWRSSSSRPWLAPEPQAAGLSGWTCASPRSESPRERALSIRPTRERPPETAMRSTTSQTLWRAISRADSERSRCSERTDSETPAKAMQRLRPIGLVAAQSFQSRAPTKPALHCSVKRRLVHLADRPRRGHPSWTAAHQSGTRTVFSGNDAGTTTRRSA